MKKTLTLVAISSLLATTVFGAEFVIPPEYDNIKNATKSDKQILITNVTGHYSSSSYDLDSTHSYKLRCIDIPKIRCGNGYTPKIHTNISSAPILREPKSKKLIYSYQTILRVEDLGDKWAVCGGAIGAVSWDVSKMTQEKNGTITYEYKPLEEQLIYYLFTDTTATAKTKNGVDGGNEKGSDNSYMVIGTNQSCEL